MARPPVDEISCRSCGETVLTSRRHARSCDGQAPSAMHAGRHYSRRRQMETGPACLLPLTSCRFLLSNWTFPATVRIKSAPGSLSFREQLSIRRLPHACRTTARPSVLAQSRMQFLPLKLTSLRTFT